MPGADFRGSNGYEGQGIVYADDFRVGGTTLKFDPPSLASGAFASSSEISVEGVQVGDSIDLFPPYSTQGIIYQASPSSSGKIIINLINASTNTVDLPSGTWGVVVNRRG